MARRFIDDNMHEMDDDTFFHSWIHATRHMNRHADRLRQRARRTYLERDDLETQNRRKRVKDDPK
jgi:hypothetical protein